MIDESVGRCERAILVMVLSLVSSPAEANGSGATFAGIFICGLVLLVSLAKRAWLSRRKQSPTWAALCMVGLLEALAIVYVLGPAGNEFQECFFPAGQGHYLKVVGLLFVYVLLATLANIPLVKKPWETIWQTLDRPKKALTAMGLGLIIPVIVFSILTPITISLAERMRHINEVTRKHAPSRMPHGKELPVKPHVGSPERALPIPRDPALSDQIIRAAYEGKPDEVKRLLRKGADPNARGNEGETVLMAACIKGDMATVRMLVEHGADVNAKDVKGWTALRYARDRRHFQIEAVLRGQGARQ